MFQIIPVTTKKQQKEFVELPLRMYKGVEWFVPPFYGDELKIFSKKNIYYSTCSSSFFLAIQDGVTVGRIQGIIQHTYNEVHKVKQARFTRFDCIDNQEIANALFDAVEKWATDNGMEFIVGPLGYSDLEREGLLIEGFDYLNTFEEQYNYPYYQKLIENYGYQKDVDWFEHRIFKSNQNKETLERLGQKALKAYNLHLVGEGMPMGKFIKKYASGIFEVIDQCYGELYGTVPFSREMMEQMITQFKLILDERYFTTICDENEKVVACGFCLPGIGKAVQKSNGKLTLPTIFRILKAVKKPESVDMAIVGILPEYRNSYVSAFVIKKLIEISEMPTVKYLETNLNLEYNHQIMSLWKRFDHIQHKKRRCYIKKFN